ncbi:MAG: glycosyltransferase family 39 protein [Phycisphaerales bacterium]|nr:glycosyltransferase family 39 protein [Phycisphaerales bacterium]
MPLRRHVLWLLLAGLFVHGLATFAVRWRAGRIDAYAFSSLDCGEYYNIARNLVGRAAFSSANAPPFVPDTWRTPGYPLFLAASTLVVGSSPAALVLVQQVLSVLSVVLLFQIARRHMSDRRAATAAALFLIEPYGLYYSFWLLSTTWFTSLLLITWWSYERAIGSRRMAWFAATGLLNGMLVLTWPGAVLVPVAVLIGLFLKGAATKTGAVPARMTAACTPATCPSPFRGERRDEGRNVCARCLPAITAFLTCCAIVIAFWMVRNLYVSGHFALSHQSGIVLAYFKATEVELWRQGRAHDRYIETSLRPENEHLPHAVWDEIDEKLRMRMDGREQGELAELRWPNLAQGNKTPTDSFEISRALTSIAWEYFESSSWATVICCVVRIGDNLIFPLGLAIERPAGVEVNRLRSAALGAVYALLAVFAVVGIIRARRRWRIVYLPVGCMVALALTTTPQIDPRFRVPMVPLLLFVALLPGTRTVGKGYSSRGSSS